MTVPSITENLLRRLVWRQNHFVRTISQIHEPAPCVGARTLQEIATTVHAIVTSNGQAIAMPTDVMQLASGHTAQSFSLMRRDT